MDLLTDLLSLSTAVFCLVIFALVWVLRKGLELKWPNLKNTSSKMGKTWRELIIPSAPLLLGGLFGYFIQDYPYPEIFAATSSRVFYGIFCGFTSGFVYRLVKKLIEDKLGKKLEKSPYSE